MILHDLAPLIRDWCTACDDYLPHDNGAILTPRGPVSLTRCKACRTERTWW